MAFKFYSVVNECSNHENDEYPDFYRILPADSQCIQTVSPISATKYTSSHQVPRGPCIQYCIVRVIARIPASPVYCTSSCRCG